MAAHAEFALNPDCAARVLYLGRERQPVLVVDELLADPEAMLRHAERGPAFRREERDFYPGIRKPLDPAYAAALYAQLHDLLAETFGAPQPAIIEPLSCALSLATTPPEQLRPIQSVPHFDSIDPDLIASVHYFCPEAFGGTAFYRHRASGHESLDAARVREYAARLKQEVMALNLQRFDYIRGDTALFERTGGVEAKFNRAIFYRSNVLHSGDIDPGTGLSADPRRGRLTANTLGRSGAG